MFLKDYRNTRYFLRFFLGIIILSSTNNLFASTIMGIVSDKQRNPLPNVDVELQNELYQQIARTKTDSSGRYQFNGLSDGMFTVKVMPFLYDLLEQSQIVEIKTITVNPSGIGNAFHNLDFYLLPRKGGLTETEIGVVFSQEIPPEAKKMYEKGIEQIAKNNTREGIMQLNEAIKLFPNYFFALYRIGKELFILGNYKEAMPFFFKAAEVNPKSAASFYYLGYSLQYLGKDYNKSAIAALSQALFLAPSSTQVLYALGKIEREEGKFQEAEKHLLQAKKLSKTLIPQIHKELAQLYANNLKKFSEAADELELYLKASKLTEAEEKQTRKIINDLRVKAKS